MCFGVVLWIQIYMQVCHLIEGHLAYETCRFLIKGLFHKVSIIQILK